MATIDLEESDNFATRQITAFLRLPTEGGGTGSLPPTQVGFSTDLLIKPSVDAFRWDNTDIYDTNGRLLFRDKVAPLKTTGSHLRVRTAADDLLRTPVFSVAAGPSLDIVGLAKKARQKAVSLGLKPISGKKALVCYSYPKLGLLCERRGARVVVDLVSHTSVPVEGSAEIPSPEAVFCWTLFDFAPPAALPRIKSLWTRAVANLPQMPNPRSNGLNEAVRRAREGAIFERTLANVQQFGQMHEMACAPASFQMILHYHGFGNLTQQDIADAMGTTVANGTDIDRQAPAVSALTNGVRIGILDTTPIFSEARGEIDNVRYPLKEGITGHARVVSGWKVDQSGDVWEYIVDPWPVGRGNQYWERFDSVDRFNFIYVRPPVFDN